MDSRALVGTTVDPIANITECMAVKQADGSDNVPPLTPPCTNPFYGGMNKAKTVTTVQQDCIDWYYDDPPPLGAGHAWLETPPPVQVNAPCFTDVPNEMWVQFKYGVYIIFSMMMIITIFYWLTGRGHILSG